MASFIVYGDASGQVTVAAPAVAGSNTITFPAETGTLVTSASTIAALPGQIAWDTTVKTSGFTAVAYGGYFCNTTSAAFTVTLPATPTRGQFVVIVDYAGTAATNNITVSGGSEKINGGSSKLLQTNRQGITFTYIDSTQGWLATSNVYGGSTPFINAPYTASYLVVAGGGGGGSQLGGGGGAGGYLTGTATFNLGTVYTATVGGGGNGGTSPGSSGSGTVGSQGNNSVLSGSGLSTITSTGGGGGGCYSNKAAGSGGSGGGGGGFSGTGAAGTPGQGNSGGTASTKGGGGGGATSSGSSGSPAGNGGAGTASSITGTPATYAGGGGGGATTPAAGTGGSGGGGNGGQPGSGTAGTANTGGGGGGGGIDTASGGAGGSGVVILSVPTASYSGTTTGSPTITTSGSNTIIKFTGSGTYTAQGIIMAKMTIEELIKEFSNEQGFQFGIDIVMKSLRPGALYGLSASGGTFEIVSWDESNELPPPSSQEIRDEYIRHQTIKEFLDSIKNYEELYRRLA